MKAYQMRFLWENGDRSFSDHLDHLWEKFCSSRNEFNLEEFWTYFKQETIKLSRLEKAMLGVEEDD